MNVIEEREENKRLGRIILNIPGWFLCCRQIETASRISHVLSPSFATQNLEGRSLIPIYEFFVSLFGFLLFAVLRLNLVSEAVSK